MSFGKKVIGKILGDRKSRNYDRTKYRVDIDKLGYKGTKDDSTECTNCGKGIYISDKKNPYSQKHKAYFCSKKCVENYGGD